MELALSLGDASTSFLDKAPPPKARKDLEFRVGLGITGEERGKNVIRGGAEANSEVVPLQLDLLPFSPVPRGKPSQRFRLPWFAETRNYIFALLLYIHVTFLQ